MERSVERDSRTEPVWDVAVRIFHWTLVVGFFTAYFTEGEPLSLHVWAGYVVCSLVLLRIVWGFVGSRHARFSDFVFPLRRVLADLADSLRLRAPRFIGHSPAGGAMILALLVMLTGTTLTGMAFYAVDDGKGPLSFILARGVSTAVDPAAVPRPVAEKGDQAEDEDDEDGNKSPDAEFWEEAHELFANATPILVILHIGGVALASLSHRENLVRAMIDGRKRPLP